jgi:hypothetical protein
MVKSDLDGEVLAALKAEGGSAGIVALCRRVWETRETDLQNSGELFFTWQYDIRWAANRLRRSGKLKPVSESPRGVWELA